MKNHSPELIDLVLGTFSFYGPMTFSKVILDLSESELRKFPDFSKEDLEEIISLLIKKKQLKAVTIDKETGWIRIHPKKSWLKRLFPL